ncbi:DUF4340 domain-containing protein, partial [Candidatus Sumerlaeota bacterium]|nr:DUF4340 domain-containing protein [Candidatus Sumerlaeota bacterium]
EMATFSGGRSPRVRSANATHTVTESLNPTTTLLVFHEARPLEVGLGDQGVEREIESLLVTTRRNTWLTPITADPDETSAPPPNSLERRDFHVAVAVTRFQPAGAGTSRLVVVGDSDWLTDRFLQLPVLRESAERLLRGAVGWLVEAEDLIAIPPRTPPQTPIMLTGPQQRFASAVAVILLPELLLALGVGMMLLRDRPERRRATPPVVWGLASPLLALAGAASLGFDMPLIGALLVAAGLIALLILALQSPPRGARIAAALMALLLGLALAVVWSIPALRAAGGASITVHPITARVLAGLERDVTALSIGEAPEMLTRLQQCSPRIRVEALSPATDGERIASLSLEHGFRLMEGDILLIGGDGLLQGPRTAKLVPQGADEQRWVNALMDIGVRRPTCALLTEGHGEWSLRSDMTKLGEIFGQLAIAAEQVPLRRDSQADFIMIAGPTEDFTQSELEILDRHVDQGGGLLVFLDPPSTAWIRSGGSVTAVQEPAALCRWLEDRWALTLAPGIVVDDDPQLIEAGFGNVSPLISGFSENHPISQRVVQQIAEDSATASQTGLQVALMLTEARPVGFPLSPPPQSIDREFLIATRQGTWLESDVETLIQQGEIAPEGATRQSLSLGAAVQLHRAHRSAHLVMIGDSDCLTDAQQQNLVEVGISTRPLLQLLRSAIGWVTPENRRVFFADPQIQASPQVDPQAAATQSRARTALTVSLLVLLGGLISLIWRRGGLPRLSPLILGTAAALLLGLWLSAPSASPGDVTDEVSLISLPPGDVTSISIEREDNTLTFERREGRWEIVGGFELPATEEGLDLLLRALSHRSRGDAQSISPQTDLASLGLDSPRARVTLRDRRGRTETLLLGLPPLQSFTRVWAQIEGEPTVFTADADILTLALRPLGRWEDES